MSLSKSVMIIVVALAVAAFSLQLMDVWPVLTMRRTALIPAALIGAAAVISVVSVILKLHRKEPVVMTDLVMVVVMMLMSWSACLRLLEKFAGQ